MLIGPSLIETPSDLRAAAIVLLDASGNPVYGFDGSRPAVAALSNVTLTANTSAVLAAANAARRALIVYNDTSKDVRVAFAATASLTSFTFIVPSKEAFQAPLNGYTGVIAGIGAAAGAIRVTEVTP